MFPVSPPSSSSVPVPSSAKAAWARWRREWRTSLRRRLLVLGLAPLVMAFPLVMAVLVFVGGGSASSMLFSSLRGQLAGASSYLEQVRAEAGIQVSQLVNSERLAQLLYGRADRRELQQALDTAARSSGLDYLIVASADGLVLGSSSAEIPGRRLPDSWVFRQANAGVATTAYERFGAADLDRWLPGLAQKAEVGYAPGSTGAATATESDGLVIHAAAHFPLDVNNTDAVLLGGILLNRNSTLVEHMREIIYPVGMLPGDAEGVTSIHTLRTSVVASRQRQQGLRTLGEPNDPAVVQQVKVGDGPWLGRIELAGTDYVMGYQAIADGEGQHIGMVGAGFPDASYRIGVWLMLGGIAGLLALTMLGLSVVFLRTGRELTQRLQHMSDTMTLVGAGQRGARVGEAPQADELARLAHHFNGLLDTIAAQDERSRQTQQELENYRIGLEKLVAQRTHELQDRSEQLATIFALSPDGFVSFDSELKLQFSNQAFLRMTGLVLPEVIGLDEARFTELLVHRCLPRAPFPGFAALRTLARRIAAGDAGAEGVRRQLMELAGPGGRVLEVGLREAQGASVSQILYFRDVTYEMEVDRMKSEFLSTAAHELRTPMASIYGYAEVLQMEGFEEEVRKEMLGTIYRQSELMASIINELLDLARIEARRGKDFVLERMTVQDILGAAVADFRVPDGRAQPVIVVAPQPLVVQVDRKKMQQAVLNVLSNAYKYSPQGGEVQLLCTVEEQHGQRRASIEVRDHGIGMTPEQLERVCERFYRADTSGKIPGTGLGMSIVKEIVELHGGQVQLRSQIGQGTSAFLFLPLA